MATKMWIAIFAFSAALLATLAPVASAQDRGDVIIQHQGMNDPATEGWCPVNNFGQSICVGVDHPEGVGVIEDGEEAWLMDPINLGHQAARYFVYDMFKDNPILLTEGFVMSARLKMTADSTNDNHIPGHEEHPIHGYAGIGPREGQSLLDFYVYNLGADGVRNSHPEGGRRIIGSMPEGFNDYKVTFVPNDGQDGVAVGLIEGVVTMSVNDVDYFVGDRFNDFEGYGTDFTWFGHAQSSSGPSFSTIYWAEVKLSVIPEPTALSLLVLGSVALWGPMVFRRRGVRA